ncbi:MAG: aldo/keto reductase [Acidobacteriota bacterium]|nr:aldo/keto reductase [Acidobacteriota bacterium]
MRYKPLGSTGASVSILGFGASPLGNVFGQADPTEAERAVHEAVGCGINLFDVSPYYGRTLAEERLGKALAGKREQVMLATKCGRYSADAFDFSARRVETSVDESLRRLKTEYVDILQVHDVEFGGIQQIIDETIPALRRIQEKGKARFIGITGYALGMLREIAGQIAVDTVLSYCRYNLMITDMDLLLTPAIREKGIGLINASPFHMGILTEEGAPAWHPAPRQVKDAGARVVEHCRKRGVDPSMAALRFCLDHAYVSSTLAGMATAKHVRNNLRALDMELDPALLEEIQTIVKPVKDTVWMSGRAENADFSGTREKTGA